MDATGLPVLSSSVLSLGARRGKVARRVNVLTHRIKRVSQTPRAFTNWPTLLTHMLRSGSTGPEELTFVTRTGLRVTCPNRPGARVPVYEVFAEDTYRLDWFLGSLAAQPIRVVDIGAHVGAFACQLAQRVPQATLFCYEPSEATAAYLRRNVTQNGLSSRITVSELAVASTTGWAEFADNGAGSALNGLASATGAAGTIKVQTISLAEVMAAAGGPVEVVKIDCEGGEYDLVLGSPAELWAPVQRVVLEYHPSSQHGWADLRAWFEKCGLHVVAQEAVSADQGTAWLSRQPLEAD
jgi:FkbM family methyltransferase